MLRKPVSAFMAVIILMGSLAACGSAKEQQVAAKPSAEVSEEAADPEETLITVTQSQLRDYLENSSCMWEFAQRFYKDVIVYKTKTGSYNYAQVNKDLPLSDYDWSNLVECGTINHRQVEYLQDGEVVSVKGIDVSSYQGDIDWARVAADGVKYVLVRAGYRGYSTGKLVTDEKFEQNCIGAAENGIGVGVYFVTQAVSVEEAEEEADHILKLMEGKNITWPVVLDLEDAADPSARTAELTAAERTDYIIAFCEKIKKAGYTPMLYSNIRWYVEEMELDRLTDYQKWFAQYFNQPFFPYQYQMWQYTSSGRVDGITGDVDLNISFVDYSKGDTDDGNQKTSQIGQR